MGSLGNVLSRVPCHVGFIGRLGVLATIVGLVSGTTEAQTYEADLTLSTGDVVRVNVTGVEEVFIHLGDLQFMPPEPGTVVTVTATLP